MNPRLLLLPFSLLYGFVIFMRNRFYDWGIFTENKFTIPVISVGNISTGGTGKTPHIEYLVKLLSGKNVATVSRGYGRNTNGFRYVEINNLATEVGDEPLQLKNKFPAITVAVCEQRKTGIEKILKENKQTEIILLDDAFQHRAVKPSLSVLLFDYSKILKTDFLLPAGDLREPFSEKKRADVIIISKCPETISDEMCKKISNKIQALEKQQVFFSALAYAAPTPVFVNPGTLINKDTSVLLVTGIADAGGIKNYVGEKFTLVKHLAFNDHHQFSETELKNIAETFATIAAEKKIILTSEKDSMRLKNAETLKKLPVYFLPVEVKFSKQDEEKFNNYILNHVGKN